MSTMNFLDWIKKIDIEILNQRYDNEFKNMNQWTIEEIKNELDRLKASVENDFNNKINNEELLKYDYLENLFQIKNYYQNSQSSTFKTRKYKLLYFLYAAFIHYKGYYNLKDVDFFESEENIKWFAFKNGPVTNHYRWGFEKEDREILIKLNDEKIELFLKNVYKVLNNFSTERLIKKSHETEPWKKSYKERYYDEIKKELIKKHFKKTPPFFIDLKNNETKNN